MAHPAQERPSVLKRHNLEVTFRDEIDARRAARSLERAGLDAELTLGADEDVAISIEQGLRHELESTSAVPPAGLMTKGQTKGVVAGVPVGLVIGAALMYLVGLVVWPSDKGLMVMAAIGAVAGGVVGFVSGGMAGSRHYEEGRARAFHAVVGVHADSTEELDKAASLLDKSDVIRIDHIDRSGRPTKPATADTRPIRGRPPV